MYSVWKPKDNYDTSASVFVVQFNGFTKSVNEVMRMIKYNSVLTFKLQIEFVPFKIVPLGGYTIPTLRSNAGSR